MSIVAALQYLFPGIDLADDCTVRDDGSGAYLDEWHRPEPRPTQADIDAAIPAALEAAARAEIRPVTARQMLLALDEAGLLDNIETYVASQPKAVKIAWNRSQEFARNDPMLNEGATALGMTDAQIDSLFELARSK